MKRKEGNEVVVQNENGVEKRRNSSFIKPFVQAAEPSMREQSENVETKGPEENVEKRPSRQKRMPAKFFCQIVVFYITD